MDKKPERNLATPLVRPTSETTATVHHFPPPTRLQHQAIFMLPYAPFDGPHVGHTDAKYLSIGRAQWENDLETLSAKVWRHTGDRWNRFSEEVPLHRLADLCTLLVKTFYQRRPAVALEEATVIDAGTFENQAESIELRRMIHAPEGFFDSGSEQNQRIKERLRKLRDELVAADLE